MRWILVASIVVVGVAGTAWAVGAGNGHGHPQHRPVTVTLGPGQYVLELGARTHVGDRIRCITTGMTPAGGGPVMPPGQGVGSSTGFSEFTRGGAAHVTCPAHPGVV